MKEYEVFTSQRVELRDEKYETNIPFTKRVKRGRFSNTAATILLAITL